MALATVVHTANMLLVAGVLALVCFHFYDTVGLAVLRPAWFNFDLLWSLALLVVATAVIF
jgi:hypothetical protein